MTQDEIIEMARDTANHGTHANGEVIYTFYSEQLEAFAKLVAAKALAQEKALQALHSENERLGLYKDAYAQRTWVGLTDDDTFEIGERLGLADVAWIDLMKAIEAKLKEVNT